MSKGGMVRNSTLLIYNPNLIKLTLQVHMSASSLQLALQEYINTTKWERTTTYIDLNEVSFSSCEKYVQKEIFLHNN